MKRILITGANGQLGSTLRKLSVQLSNYNCTFIDIDNLNLTIIENVQEYFKRNHFDYLINCAAYTAVDLAEENHEPAYLVNHKVPELLTSQCPENTRLIHISTDYVYDGSVSKPHVEDESLKPLSVYAKSKLEGEKALWNNPLGIVIRTSWLYSEYGNNFLKTMIRLGREKKEINVVYDQTGTPTYAGDLAAALFGIISYSEANTFKAGVYNYSNEGVCSWYDFAIEIMKVTGSKCSINPVRSEEYELRAPRPAYSVMDKSKIKRNFDLHIPHWRDSLLRAVRNLENQ